MGKQDTDWIPLARGNGSTSDDLRRLGTDSVHGERPVCERIQRIHGRPEVGRRRRQLVLQSRDEDRSGCEIND